MSGAEGPVMELNVTVRGNTEAEIEEGLSDALGLVQAGFTRLDDDPQGQVEFVLRDDEERG
jgi:hypothetical protein